ncbi:MAG: polysaccharide pyruvyl transferase family protein [Leptolyngbya sp. Prado105]|jgi:hypothetical protein|nr:polysaccharide pyruvyl transferase family protein [Leptolyngbya sp. Prado105]
MKRGIYIVANDKVTENAIALLNSIRLFDPEIPVYLIPFNDEYHYVLEVLNRLHRVELFPDMALLERLTSRVGEIFERDFLKLPNKMRKLAAWFGILDEFIYIDTDIVVFDRIAETLNYLSRCDFFCCDYHYASEGLSNIFSPMVRDNIFTREALQDVFNSGFWGSRKGVICEEQLYEVLKDCAQHPEYFDFTQGVTDQPILNYLVLKCFDRRMNLVKPPENAPGSWAGSKHFEHRQYVLYDRGQKLNYLHWAGISIRPGAPYWEVWEHYRHLHEPETTFWRKLSRLMPFAN